MIGDLIELSRLRWRHLRGRAVYWAALAGADIQSNSLLEQSYLLYVLLIGGAWGIAMGAAAADAARALGVDGGESAAEAIRFLAQFAPGLLVGGFGVRALRSSPVKLTFPDIAYFASGAMDPRAIALSSYLREGIPAAAVASFVGYLVGCVAQGTGAPQAGPWLLAGSLPLVVMASLAIAWAGGLARIRIDGSSGRYAPVALIVLSAALLGSALRVGPWTPLAHAVDGSLGPLGMAALVAVACTAVALIARVAPRMDMTTIIAESAMYAELQVFRPLRLYDPGAYADIVRRKRLARRLPRGRMPRADGAAALVARALLSHLRQPGSLVLPVVWGAAILPFVALRTMAPLGLFPTMPAVLVFVATPAAGVLHVFGQDADRPSLRSLLPFGDLKLLMLDSLPALVAMWLSSVAAIRLVGFPAGGWALGGLLCVILAILVVLCAGLEHIRVRGARGPIGYGISATVCSGVVLYAGAVAPAWVSCVVAIAMVLGIGALIGTSDS